MNGAVKPLYGPDFPVLKMCDMIDMISIQFLFLKEINVN